MDKAINDPAQNTAEPRKNAFWRGFIDAFFGGVKSGEEKATILRKNTYYIGFEEDINRARKEVDEPGHFRIISNQAKDIVGLTGLTGSDEVADRVSQIAKEMDIFIRSNESLLGIKKEEKIPNYGIVNGELERIN